jgi:hypothetical protein
MRSQTRRRAKTALALKFPAQPKGNIYLKRCRNLPAKKADCGERGRTACRLECRDHHCLLKKQKPRERGFWTGP